MIHFLPPLYKMDLAVHFLIVTRIPLPTLRIFTHLALMPRPNFARDIEFLSRLTAFLRFAMFYLRRLTVGT